METISDKEAALMLLKNGIEVTDDPRLLQEIVRDPKLGYLLGEVKIEPVPEETKI